MQLSTSRLPRGRLVPRGRRRTGLLLVAPTMAVVLVFFVIPLAIMIWMSLENWPLLGPHMFAGLANYRHAFTDPLFLHSLEFTSIYAVIVTPMVFVCGYLLAMLVRRRRRGTGFLRTVYFLPVVIGMATAGYMFILEFDPQLGVYAKIFGGLGITHGTVGWLTTPASALLSISVMVTWKTAGFGMLILMAAMQGIPSDVYEAAQVDGAGWLARELRITVPLIRRAIALVLIFTLVGAYLAFDQFFVLTQGGPEGATTTAIFFIYQTGFDSFELGYAAALSVIMLVILLFLTSAQLWLLRDNTEL
jgi:multiple sugar transport system permease protein